MRIAIIGTGNVGGAIAQGLKNKGHAVTLGARDPDAPAMITLGRIDIHASHCIAHARCMKARKRLALRS